MEGGTANGGAVAAGPNVVGAGWIGDGTDVDGFGPSGDPVAPTAVFETTAETSVIEAATTIARRDIGSG